MRAYSVDYPLIIVSAVLLVLGVLILSSISAVLSQENFGYPTYYLVHQLIYGLLLGIVLGFLTFRIPISFFRKWAFLIFFINLIILGLVFIPKIGILSGGASRWINLGPLSFQPAETLKVSFIIYLAAWLSNLTGSSVLLPKRTKGNNIMLVAFLLIIGALSTLLVLQPNVGTLGVIFATALLMYFAAGTPLWHAVFTVAAGVSLLFLLVNLAPYRLSRFLVFLNPELDPLGKGYQIKQALIAVGSGGIFGLGLGLSRQKFGFLPQPVGDSIFAIFAEEVGFIGAAFLVILFLFLIWRGFKISRKAQDKFSQLVALGIVSWIGLQAFVNMGSMIGILPLTGVPLPFVSYGGSHLIAEIMGIGLLLNISRHKK